MAATELQNRSTNGAENGHRDLSEKVAEQVSEILRETDHPQPARPALAYRVPSPGVRYYF